MNINELCKNISSAIKELPLKEKVEAINKLRESIHEHSPFKTEPVDFVRWVENTKVGANDYNPNSVAPPEMELLKHSIQADGYTQPIVSWNHSDRFDYEVIDGFHRHRVGKEDAEIQERVKGYLPLVVIKEDRDNRNDRIASTIRHNRARGKHAVESMANIVVDLKKRNWSDKKIGKELGMDADEVLRLTQITGLTEMFKDTEFSEAWSVGEYEEKEEVINNE